MNIIEENGKKMAAVLCVASCFPVIATVYAMETNPGWHGDKYISEDATVVKGWQEIGDKSYYFKEDGDVDKEATEEATATTINTDITENVQEAVKESTVAAVTETNEEQAIAEETVVTEEAVADVATTEVADTTVVTEETPVVEETAVAEEAAPVEETYVEETYTEEAAPVEETYVEETYTEEYVAPVEETYTEETYDTSSQYSSLNDRIVSSALSLVDVTDGQWCTEVATEALQGAGVDAAVLWPDQYVQYGYYTDTPEAGNLVYYYNGGRGVDHIAVYIGDGMAVHGNYNGETVVASVYIPGGAPQYIQIVE